MDNATTLQMVIHELQKAVQFADVAIDLTEWMKTSTNAKLIQKMISHLEGMKHKVQTALVPLHEVIVEIEAAIKQPKEDAEKSIYASTKSSVAAIVNAYECLSNAYAAIESCKDEDHKKTSDAIQSACEDLEKCL